MKINFLIYITTLGIEILAGLYSTSKYTCPIVVQEQMNATMALNTHHASQFNETTTAATLEHWH